MLSAPTVRVMTTTTTAPARPATARLASETIGTEGVWEVTTETSRYVIDLDQLRVTRLPHEGAGALTGLRHGPVTVSDLPGDGDSQPLLGVELCTTGMPLVMYVSLPEESGGTRDVARISTLVRRIRQIG